jgi:predicted component of type VI protein secretion system
MSSTPDPTPSAPEAPAASAPDLKLEAPVTRGQFFKAVERLGDKLEEQLNAGLKSVADQTSLHLADHRSQLAQIRKELATLDRKVWISLQLNMMILSGELKPPMPEKDLTDLLEDLSKEYDNAAAEVVSANDAGGAR